MAFDPTKFDPGKVSSGEVWQSLVANSDEPEKLSNEEPVYTFFDFYSGKTHRPDEGLATLLGGRAKRRVP